MKNTTKHTTEDESLTMTDHFSTHSCAFLVKTIFTIIFLISTAGVSLWAQSGGRTAKQSLTLEVKPIAKISVTGNPGPLVINDENAGGDVAVVSDENTKYNLVTNIDNMKIVASINDRMPDGTKLIIKLTSTRAASAGSVDLSDAMAPVDVVTGIKRGSDVDQSISYIFAANADVLEIPAQSRTVTLTLTN